jgi:prepilin-type N-terminal cleavage/methylation domain-containing protein
MRQLQRGVTLLELLAALAVGAIVMVGLMTLIDSSIEDTKGQQASLYQSQVAKAAAKYIDANYATLVAGATATTPVAVNVAALKSSQLLSASFNATNAYGQVPCVLVLQPSAGKLDALVVTEGGVPIPAKDAAYVAANAGSGGGHIPAATPTVAQGAFNSWSVPVAPFVSRNCSGTPAAAGRLASALFFDGPNNLSFDYLYRGPVPGHPELNRMSTPLHMNAKVVENTSDALCTASDATSYGRIAVDADGRVMSCQLGLWKPSGSGYWKDPVATYAALPAAGNSVGDVRMVDGLGRAFTWNGTGWVALAVDQNGNLAVPGAVHAGRVELTEVAIKGGACAPNGTIARDGSGLPLFCESGAWRDLNEVSITTTALDQYFLFQPAGGTQDFHISLAAIPGPRPLYLTGVTHCNSNGPARAMIAVEVFDALNRRLAYAGGCGVTSQTDGRVLTKAFIGLQKVPANAASLRIYAEPGSVAGDLSDLRLMLQNSR